MKTKLLIILSLAICGIANAQLTVNLSSTNVLCNGQCNGTATATTSGGTVPYTYLWSTTGQTTSAVSGLCPGTYSVTVTDALGFTAMATDTITEPPPFVTNFQPIYEFCPGTSATINSGIVGGTPPYTYLWYNGATTSTIGVYPIADTNYYSFTLVDSNGCTASDSMQILVLTAAFTYTVTGNTVNFSDHSTGTISAWNWSFPGGTPSSSNTQNPIVTYSTSGTYSVCLTVTLWLAGCTDTTCGTVVVTPMGIQHLSIDEEVSIYPNPFSSSTTLHTDNLLKNATLTVDNCFGQTVKQVKNISGHTVVFSRDNLACGLYFLHLIENNKTLAVDKLVITDK